MGWYAQAARGQMEILAKREAIVALINNPETDPELAERLKRVLDIRRFASDELHLPDNRSYTHYADLGRSAVLWNVVAAPEFSLTPKTWCYPIAGCVAYRGYFRRVRADKQAARLSDDGWDVSVSPVPAYSTLGRFADPVFNTMMAWSDARLAGIIFHELAHQQVYVRGDTAFNESYASFVEQRGIEQWLAARGGDMNAYQRECATDRTIRAMILETRDELIGLYRQDRPEPAMRADKAAAFETLKARYRDLRRELDDTRFDAWMAQPLNNAHLALFAAYESGVDAFAGLFDEAGGDWEAFHRAVATLAEADNVQRATFLKSSRIARQRTQ